MKTRGVKVRCVARPLVTTSRTPHGINGLLRDPSLVSTSFLALTEIINFRALHLRQRRHRLVVAVWPCFLSFLSSNLTEMESGWMLNWMDRTGGCMSGSTDRGTERLTGRHEGWIIWSSIHLHSLERDTAAEVQETAVLCHHHAIRSPLYLADISGETTPGNRPEIAGRCSRR